MPKVLTHPDTPTPINNYHFIRTMKLNTRTGTNNKSKSAFYRTSKNNWALSLSIKPRGTSSSQEMESNQVITNIKQDSTQEQ
jgi:hypothetical protein